MQRFANPARFLRLSARLLPWLAGATLLLLAARAVPGAVRLAARLPAGRDGADHVRPRARRLDGAVLLHLHGGRRRPWR